MTHPFFKRGSLLSFSLFLLLAGFSCNRIAKVNNGNQSGTESQAQVSQEHVNSPLPPPTGFVNDYANVFGPQAKQRLESVLGELRDKSEIEFAVVTVETTGGQPIFDYSLAVARGWGVGPKDTSRGGGIVLLVAVKDRQWRLQVSRSLEQDLPDDVCKALGERSTEFYKQGKYAEGISQYVKTIIGRLEEIRKFKLSGEL